jgi:hypothetical protein
MIADFRRGENHPQFFIHPFAFCIYLREPLNIQRAERAEQARRREDFSSDKTKIRAQSLSSAKGFCEAPAGAG